MLCPLPDHEYADHGGNRAIPPKEWSGARRRLRIRSVQPVLRELRGRAYDPVFDLNRDRIQLARESSVRLGLADRIQFENCNVLDYEFKDQVDTVVMLDLIHHIPRSAVPDLIGHFYDTISKNGVVLIKDIESKPWWKVVFTWILDKAMDPKTQVHYYSKEQMIQMLEGHGFDVKCHQLLDILPYPHILYICRPT